MAGVEEVCEVDTSHNLARSLRRQCRWLCATGEEKRPFSASILTSIVNPALRLVVTSQLGQHTL